jgi:hypothetical protein
MSHRECGLEMRAISFGFTACEIPLHWGRGLRTEPRREQDDLSLNYLSEIWLDTSMANAWLEGVGLGVSENH